MHSKMRLSAVLAIFDVKPAARENHNTSSYYSGPLIIIHSSIFLELENPHLLPYQIPSLVR